MTPINDDDISELASTLFIYSNLIILIWFTYFMHEHEFFLI